MRRLIPAALLLLAACEGMAPPVTTAPVVPVVPAPIDLSAPPVVEGRQGGIDPVTGLDHAALVNLVPTTDGMRVYYREAAVTPAAVAAVPQRVCDARGTEVASATTRDPEAPRELPGVRILTVRCTAPPVSAGPATAPARATPAAPAGTRFSPAPATSS